MTLSNLLQLSCALALCCALPLSAQVATGTINVTVVDGTGAVVPAANIKVSNKNTGLSRTGNTNERGELLIPFLPVGEYALSVESAGFKKTAISRVPLQVDQTAGIRVPLQPGEVRELVEVNAVSPLLEADTSSLGQVIENKKILDLPLNGRNPFALGLLAGNTTPMFGMGSNQPLIAGRPRLSSNDLLLDGADNKPTVHHTDIGPAS